ncbi:MAG: YqeG family HAD IIIA-type phosphatase [Acholeplasmataceae bacterium]|jgi:uncharacterized protein
MALYLKCIPNQYVHHIFNIDYDALAKQGIKALFFDLDNTIIGYDEAHIDDKSLALLRKLSQSFKVLIISNSNKKRVLKATANVEFPVMWRGVKPLKFGFKKALKKVSKQSHEVALIGDQLMTDVLGGNRMGFETILVNPVVPKSDIWMTKMNRMFEKWILRKIAKKEPALYQERLAPYVNQS